MPEEPGSTTEEKLDVRTLSALVFTPRLSCKLRRNTRLCARDHRRRKKPGRLLA